jgi:hypothetical protein
LDAAIKIAANKANFYLANTLNIKAAWNSETGAADTVGQQLQTDRYQFYNNFELIKTLPNKKTVRFYSFNGYMRTPQRLDIQPGLYADMLNYGQSFTTLEQTSSSSHFSSRTSFNFSTAKRSFKQHYYGGIDIDIQRLYSLLQPLRQNGVPATPAPDSLQNELHWQTYRTYITGEYTYSWRYFRIEASLPVSYRLLLIEDVFPQNKQTINRVLFTPNIAVTYDLNRCWKLKATYSFTNSIGTLQNSYTGYLMQNYRNFNRNDGRLADYKTHSYGLRTIYRDALKALFANVDVYYEQYHSNVLREQSFTGLLQVQNTISQPVVSQVYGVNGSVSKSLYALRSTISLSANYYESASSQIMQGALIEFRYRNYGFKPTIESRLSSWGGISYALLWNESRSIVASDATAYPLLRSVSNRITLNLFPVSGLMLTASYEHYHNNAVSEGRNRSFADLGVSYKFKSVELAFAWSNIFNAKQYVIASYDNISAFLSVYEVRPAQILVTAKFKLW